MNFGLFWATVQEYLIRKCHLGLGLVGLLNSIGDPSLSSYLFLFLKEHFILWSISARQEEAVRVYARLAKAPEIQYALALKKKK